MPAYTEAFKKEELRRLRREVKELRIEREILKNMQRSLALNALKMAINTRKIRNVCNKLIHHSNQRIQYISYQPQLFLR